MKTEKNQLKIPSTLTELQAQDLAFYNDSENYMQFLNAREQWDLGVELALWAAATYGGSKGPILELGCGSGRITEHLLAKGYNVTGLDLSRPLLDTLIVKTQSQSYPGVLTAIEGDFTDFHIELQYPLIMTTGCAFGHLYNFNQLQAHFTCVRAHLAEKGVYIFDTVNPKMNFLINPDERKYGEYFDKQFEETVQVFNRNQYDPLTQINHSCYRYHSPHVHFEKQVAFRMLFPQELDAWIRLSGLEIVEKFGTYSRLAFSEKPIMQIVVCQKPNSVLLKF